MLPSQGGVRLMRWRTSRGSPIVVLGAGWLWRYQNNLDVCGWCDEEQANDHQLWRGFDVENAPRGGSVGVRTVSFSDATAKLLCDLKWIKQSHVLKITPSLPFFFRCSWTVPPLLGHKVLRSLYSSVEISFIEAWRSLLRHPSPSCVAANPSFNGVASPNHLSLSFTWCGFSRSPFPFFHLVQLF